MPRTLLWLLDQTHLIIPTLTFITLLQTRSVQVEWFILGAVGVNTLAKILKNVIRQDRPITVIRPSSDLTTTPTEDDDSQGRSKNKNRPKAKVKRTYGMPSTHSTSIGFYMSYLFLTLPLFTRTSSSSPLPIILRGYLGTLANLAQLGWGSAIIYSRVEMGYHTVAQVMVGAGLGVVGGWAWKSVWQGAVSGTRGEVVLEEWMRWGFGLVGW